MRNVERTLQRDTEELTRVESADRGRLELAQHITRETVLLLREYTGKGPTQAKTILTTDVITCVMRNTLTKGERRLVDQGRGDSVIRMRKAIQDAMRDQLVALVEELTGRRVDAFLSDNTLSPDVAIEAFVLEADKGPD